MRRFARVMVTLAWLAASTAGCDLDPAPFWERAVGERARHVSAAVSELPLHRIELSEFVFHGTERWKSGEVSFVQRVVLVADVQQASRDTGSGTVQGYTERRYADGRRAHYRLAGRLLRMTGTAASVVTVFDLTALHTADSPGPASLPVAGVRYSVPFRLRVDEETGSAVITPRGA